MAGMLLVAQVDGSVHSVQALSCGSMTRHFAGNFGQLSLDGASARIETVNEALCTTSGSDAFSSSWVAVVSFGGSGAGPYAIYQVGLDDCKNAACPSGPANNVPYFFYAYGREAANGCTEVAPTAHYISDAASGIRTYTIQKATDALGHLIYQARVSGNVVNSRTAADLETCWGAVDGYSLLNEVLNVNDQNGGPNLDRQNWESPQYHTTSGWHSVTRTAGSDCDAIDQPANSRCQWASDGSGKWWSWDTRY